MSTELGATRAGILKWRDLHLAERIRYSWIIGKRRRGQIGEVLKSLTNLTCTTFNFNITLLNVLREMKY